MPETPEKPVPEAQASAANAEAASLNAQLEEANSKLAKLSARLEKLETIAKPDTSQDKAGRESSRLFITGALALAGVKLGGMVGMKIAGGKQIYAAIKAGSADNLLRLDWKELKSMMLITTAASGIGGAVGAVFGWRRGDRIKHAGDILAHPLDTLKTLIKSDAAYKAEHPEYHAKVVIKEKPVFDNTPPEPTVREDLGAHTSKLLDAPAARGLSI